MRSGVTGFELALTLTVSLAGIISCFALGERFGPLGYVLGFPAGGLVSFGAIFVCLLLFAVFEDLWKRNF